MVMLNYVFYCSYDMQLSSGGDHNLVVFPIISAIICQSKILVVLGKISNS